MGKDYQKYVFTFASNYVSIHASNSLPPITKVMADDRTESRIFREIGDWLIHKPALECLITPVLSLLSSLCVQPVAPFVLAKCCGGNMTASSIQLSYKNTRRMKKCQIWFLNVAFYFETPSI